MGIQCGIVGLPNVGKSTLFNCLTKAGVDAANYPFCTIEPNVGVVSVPDTRLDQLAAIVKPQQVIPTTVEFVDIAGLVKGAAQGEGLGNQFLANIRETDAIAHVVRCFEHNDIIHVAGKVAPLDDIEVIQTELALADLETVERARLRLQKSAKSGDKTALAQLETLTQLKAHLDRGQPARTLTLGPEAFAALKPLQLLTLKPTLYIANVAEDGFSNNPYLDQVTQLAAHEKAPVVALSASLEADIMDLADEERRLFLTELGLKEPGLHRVIRAAYTLLGLETFFTAGEKEVRAWTIPQGATAPEAAGVIHTDFAKGFIRAEVIAFDDYLTYRGEQGAKDAGKWRLEGKDYRVKDGDVIYFRFNV